MLYHSRFSAPFRKPLVTLAAVLVCASVTGCGGKRIIHGQILSRNGDPMDRVIVSLDPGGVELITDEQGAFAIDYLRDDEGERVKLDKKTDYTLEAFRTGYHIERMNFYFKRGELFLDPLTMKEDTIRLRASDDDIDPERFPDRTNSSGSNYEGE
ncbi:MAG: hypothetical protein GXP62_09800 [Oligoflexia bacterium]|nr:hypothetical protein [Oligoflexia bacterium]